ncbi:MAG: HlyC/CorC family transporter [Gemmatimonadetes bacterium]|nr:HlyC/CorC family transporter [Gemmatimonadota bacterium]
MNILELVAGILAGLVMAAFFAACEGAFLALSSSPDASFAETARPQMSRVSLLLRRSDRLKHGIALGQLLAIVWVATMSYQAAWWVAGGRPGAGGFSVAVLVTAFLMLVFADMAPKSAAMERPAAWARTAGPLLVMWMLVTLPLTTLLAGLVSRSQRLLGPGRTEAPFLSEDARSIVAEASEKAELERDERQMITSIFSFGDTTVREVMTPRPDVVAVDIGADWSEVVRKVGEAEHSRVPVYRDELDAIVGVLHAKDLLPYVHGQDEPPMEISDLLWEPTFVPEAKKIDDLLREFQTEKTHLAIVVDEYGGTAGIVTLEDILEELVGDIQDENDREEPLVESLPDGELRLDGRLDFDDFNELTGSRFEAEEVETIGGLVARELGRVASGGEVVSIDDWTFRVEEVDGKRIVKVRARRESTGQENNEMDASI